MALSRRLAAIGCALLWLGSVAHAQTWPASPIKMIVPYAAGGATDALARLIAGKLQDQMNTPVIVDNRAGAGGNLGTNVVAKAAPDGYTILFNINGHAISPAIYKSLPYDADKDFVRVTQLVSTTSVMVVLPTLPVKSLPDLIAYTKANPGKLNYGSTGVGNSLHLIMEMVKHATGMDIQMVPFRGDAPLFSAMFGGEVQVAIVPLVTAKAHIDSGALRAIAVTTRTRASAMPEVPTIAESGKAVGLGNFDIDTWFGLFGPAKLPPEVTQRLNKAFVEALNSPELKARLADCSAGAAGAWGRCGDQQDARRGGEGGEAAWDAAGICAGVWPQAGDLVHARVAQDDKATARREQQ